MATVVSFYSDRDGIGRSMAVATMGWIIAATGKRVAVVDWDLEKPTLHKYLGPFILDYARGNETGIIDVLWSYSVKARRNLTGDLGAILEDSAKGVGSSCTIPAESMSKTGGELTGPSIRSNQAKSQPFAKYDLSQQPGRSHIFRMHVSQW